MCVSRRSGAAVQRSPLAAEPTEFTHDRVLARPRTLEPDVADVAWWAGGVGAAAAFNDVTAKRYSCHWPDRAECSSAADDDRPPEIVITASTLLTFSTNQIGS